MKVLLYLIFLLSFSALAMEAEISGNIETQARHSWNNPVGKDEPLLGQDWEEDNFFMTYGNLTGKLDFKSSRLEANWFNRYSESNLYTNPNYVAPQIFLFPRKLVARDLFKMQYKQTSRYSQTESILNKMFYEWEYDEHKFTIGRMYINYGQGEIFNPINPFNQPTGLTSVSQVAQGNDGVGFSFYVNDKHTMDFYFLGDKSFDDYNGEVANTIWLHGEYQATDSLQLDYALGQDQKRDKLGGQVSYRLGEGLIFAQGLYQSAFVNDMPSHNLLDLVLGYDLQLTSKWHLRTEGGYQKTNRYNLAGSFAERFLPTEYFVAVANQYEIHPLIKLSGTIIYDIKTGFAYGIAKSTFDLGHDFEGDIFGYSPIVKGQDVENVSQKLVTTDVGLALRMFF